MSNSERRGGPPHPMEDDEPIEATRAIRLDEDEPLPTAAFSVSQLPIRSPAPPARPPQAPAAPHPPTRPMQPVRPMPSAPPVAAAPRPLAMPPPPEDDQSTRMLDVAEVEAATRAIDTNALANMRPGGKPLTPMELRTVSGPDRGKIHRVPEGKHLVGRGLDCNIVLADPAVSRKHFQIERTEDQAVLSDLGGANGTSINGVKKPRHVLESGDRVEIGTSVLEFYIEGAAPVARNRQAMPERDLTATPQVLEARTAQRKKLFVRVAIVLGIVAVGGGVGALLATRKAPPPAKPVVAEPVDDGAAEVAAAIAKAKELLSETPPDFGSALDVLKAAKKKDPTNKELKKLIVDTRKEVDAQDTFEEAKQAFKAGDFQGAINKFGEVGKDLYVSADAQDELTAAKEALFSQRMTDAKRANESGDTAGAIAALDAILAVDPNRAEAKAMRGQLGGDEKGDDKKADAKGKADPKPGLEAKPTVDAKPAVEAKAASEPKVKPEAKAVPEAKAAPEPKPAAKAAPSKPGPKEAAKAEPKETAKPEPKKGVEKVEAGPKADFGAAMLAYHGRQWTAAVQAFDAVAQGGHSKDQKAKAAAFAAAVRQVESSLNDASAAGSNVKKAINAYKTAYQADRRVDGTHGPFIAGKLADAYLGQAKAALAAKKYQEAFEDANEALNYQPDKAEATQIVDKCVTQAGTLWKEAKDLMDKKNYMAARDLARTVARILPTSDKRQQEAQDMAKKATELSRQDAD